MLRSPDVDGSLHLSLCCMLLIRFYPQCLNHLCRLSSWYPERYAWISSCCFLAASFVISILISTINIRHGGWICFSIVLIFVPMYGNCCTIFSRFDLCGIRAVLVRRVFANNSCIGCFVESDSIRVVAMRVLIWNRIHVGCSPVSISIAAMVMIL